MDWPIAIVLAVIWAMPLSELSIGRAAATTFGFVLAFAAAVAATVLIAMLFL